MLRSHHVYLSPVLEKDLPTLFQWINQRDLVVMGAPYKPVSESEHQEWFQAIQKRKDAFLFGVRLVESDDLIGTCQLHGIHWIHRTAELQIRIGDPESRGKGYGTEATRLLVEFGFRDLGLRRITLHVVKGNAAALRVYEKVGFVQEGVLRQAAYLDGNTVDLILMGLLREEYRES
ncbi:MAG: GNAT family N-acetyltransferase [Planctomycetes bacterium]|nr:GNAT family N-acetyltransferase [Planctomycetota bacterium]